MDDYVITELPEEKPVSKSTAGISVLTPEKRKLAQKALDVAIKKLLKEKPNCLGRSELTDRIRAEIAEEQGGTIDV